MQSWKTINLPLCQVSLCPEVLCYGVSVSAFIYHFQMRETTLRRCLSKLTTGMVCCDALANIYLRKPTKLDAKNIVNLHQQVHKIPGMMGLLDVTKVHGKNCPTDGRVNSKAERSMQVQDWRQSAAIDNNLWFGMLCLVSQILSMTSISGNILPYSSQ